MRLTKILSLLILLCPFWAAGQSMQHISQKDFEILNLDHPGLEKVKQLVTRKKYGEASKALLNYYKKRTDIKHPDYNLSDKGGYLGKKISEQDQEKADKGLEHLFYVHKGYGFFDYGKDIDWQHWPVKDNEVRWQLHRHYWWSSMGLAYWSSGDEKYVAEWVAQYIDWVKKNPKGLSKENDRFAWRPLEVSHRIQEQTGLFNMFLTSPHFTPDFLMLFLNNYNEHAEHILGRYSDKGNHLLFEAQRMIYAGAFFPELKNAPVWRKSGIDILNTEIKKQVYPDGMQFELSPNYHTASINIFLKALRMAQLANIDHEFPPYYKDIIEKMIMAQINFSFPDYSFPMFGDAWAAEKRVSIRNFREWQQVFPDNKVIDYYATDGKKGETLPFLSHGLKDGGFYTFRNSWKDTATVMVVKASPPAFWHSQPDNGTFELWVKGRNFMPDGGVFVYGGDEEIMKLRNWYRQTKVHKTLTLNNEDMEICDAELINWHTSDNLDVLVYKNPSYKELDHIRTVLFINQKYFVVLDKAHGTDTGKVGVHFQLVENSNPLYDKEENSISTQFKDGNNLLIRNFNKGQAQLVEEEGKVSYFYRTEVERPAFVFEQNKSSENSVQFATVLYPFQGETAPNIVFQEEPGNAPEAGNIHFTISVNGEKQTVRHRF